VGVTISSSSFGFVPGNEGTDARELIQIEYIRTPICWIWTGTQGNLATGTADSTRTPPSPPASAPGGKRDIWIMILPVSHNSNSKDCSTANTSQTQTCVQDENLRGWKVSSQSCYRFLSFDPITVQPYLASPR
jgi:hypothetical protein